MSPFVNNIQTACLNIARIRVESHLIEEFIWRSVDEPLCHEYYARLFVEEHLYAAA
jgi:hypothetical protein